MEIDIVVPVWNRPMETRACIVSLLNHTPGARFILIDNGCDRETERLLQEFAEGLDDRALLVCVGANRGMVRAINLGLERAQAPYVGLVTNLCQVTEGWIEPLLELADEKPEAGLIIPSLLTGDSVPAKPARSKPPVWHREKSTGSLSVMVVRKELLDRAGGLDEELDGGFWCIRDFTRRAYRAGYLAYEVAGGVVVCREETPLGSLSRREEIERRSALRFAARWGKEQSYCVWFPKGVDAATVEQRREVLLTGARQGNILTLAIPHATCRDLTARGFERLHENLRIVPMPRFFPEGGVGKLLATLRGGAPDTIAVAGIDGMSFPGEPQSVPFSTLERSILERESVTYGH